MYLRVRAISILAGIKWLQVYAHPMCPYIELYTSLVPRPRLAIHQNPLVSTWRWLAFHNLDLGLFLNIIL